ncbi:hypothetical protein NUW58_g4830 [Xylaria curta]|uniref:Uncharacterized protein n=1 Tax=Xylaria curta TaxID=42375 RepID=A0ACC1P6B8_9PEZI|nr:hypothetical protein NUW58_g4830 [Xylaria curta]
MGAKRRGAGEEVMSRRTTERSPSEAVPKRQRVSRACDQCRAAREKCDGIRPLCFPCASQNRLCTWEEPKKKRGVQTGYIRTLEMALGWIFDKIPESENSLHGLLTHEGGQGRLLLAGKDTSAGNRLHRRWRRSTVHTKIERVLSGGATPTKSTNVSTPGEESDEDRPEEDSLTRRGEMSVSNISEPTEHLKDERNTPDIAHPRAQRPRDLTTSQMNDTDLVKSPPNLQSPTQLQRPPIVKLPSNHWRLLDIYFYL